MGHLVFIFILGVVLLVGGSVWLFLEKDTSWKIMAAAMSFLGLLLLIAATFIEAPEKIHNGEPASGQILESGSYKVAVVYVAGENVTVGVEKERRVGEEKKIEEHLYFYQYKQTDFVSLNREGTKLVVTKSPSGLVSMRLE